MPSPRKIAEGYEYRLTLTHKTGCAEWDNVRSAEALPQCLENLTKAVAADVEHYEETGRID